jgi:hypothetical protein
MLYIPKHLTTDEVVPPDVHASTATDIIWQLFDTGLLIAADRIRDYYGRVITVNNYAIGGKFTQRGFRNDQGTGARWSMHRFFKALDLDVEGIPAEQLRIDVRKGTPKILTVFEFITGIEDGVPWLHVDTGNRQKFTFFKAT